MNAKKLKNRTKVKELEYDEAPSGYVSLYNYKEPFMKFSQGYGYQGVLLFDGVSDLVQCHFCGKWFEALGNHIGREHNMSAHEYKNLVGLNETTALISEKHREKLVANGKERFKNLKSQKGKKRDPEVTKRILETIKNKKNKREAQNKRGTCPAQLIAKLQNEYQRLGYAPRNPHHASLLKVGVRTTQKDIDDSLESMKRLGSVETYISVFGSWEKALDMANIPRRKPGSNIHKRISKWPEEKAVEWFTSFIDASGRTPGIKDIPKDLYARFSNKSLDKDKVAKEAWNNTKNTKGETGGRYTREQLLKFLRNFKDIHGREPSYSDEKRGLIPHLSRYSYHFGSWKKALNTAFRR